MENLIKNNKDKFMAELPAGNRERFAMKVQKRSDRKNKVRQLYYAFASAAAIMLLFVILENTNMLTPAVYEENSKVVEIRRAYEQQLDEAVIMLEGVMKNVDDSTRNELNKVIENLTSTAEVFAEIAPLPEEKQLAITSQMYDNQLETLQIIYRKISKGEQ